MRTYILYAAILLSFPLVSQISDCEGPVSEAELNINNVRAMITNGLQHFEDNGDAAYQIQNNSSVQSNVHSIYADGLWFGGYDLSGQLHTSFVTYRTNGSTDYYAGPLRNDGVQEASSEICQEYDNVYLANRTEALLHAEYYDRIEQVANGADPSILTEFPFQEGYSTPPSFYDWPGNNPDPNYDFYLAPYYDMNGDGIYSPDDGDYPGFDLEGQFDCNDYSVYEPLPLLGHQAAWYVCNDLGDHSGSGGEAFGLEIQVTAFAYSSCDELNDATFVRNLIINRSATTYEQCAIGKWLDPDIGCPTDDYVGCDVSRGLAYAYNGDLNDLSCDGVPGFGPSLVAQGVKIFQGPHQDNDGLDNPLLTDVEQAISQGGIVYSGMGTGYGDGIIDNERIGMRTFLYYNRDDQSPTPAINGEPDSPVALNYYLNGEWLNGSEMTYGGTGVGGDIPTDFMFPGLSDPLGVATAGQIVDGNWSENTEGNETGDRRFLMSTGQFTMEPGEINEVIYGYIHGEDPSGQTDAVEIMQAAHDVIQEHFDNCFQFVNDYPLLSEFESEVNGNLLQATLPAYGSDEVVWSFGDGTLSEGYSVSHEYTSPGYYEVCAIYEQCGVEHEVCKELYFAPGDFYPLVRVTRMEGRGNGDNFIQLVESEIQNMLEGPDYYEAELTYLKDYGPVKIAVYDEFSFVPGDYVLRIYDGDEDYPENWKLWKVGETDTIYSQESIEGLTDQYIPEYGLVVSIAQPDLEEVEVSSNKLPLLLHASKTYENASQAWLAGVPDNDLNTEQNWIRAGTNTIFTDNCDPENPEEDCYYGDKENIDPNERFEDILGGTWSPYHLTSVSWAGPFNSDFLNYQFPSSTRMTDLNNIVLRFTSDKNKWTRSAAVETQNFSSQAQGGARKNLLRIDLSVDKNGLNQLNGGDYDECTMNGTQVMTQEYLDDLSTAEKEAHKAVAWPSIDPGSIPDSDLIGLSFGMGWFPGYAVDIESGYRVHIAFGENSALPLENGRDMIWNPTSTVWNDGGLGEEDPNNARFGGGHFIYVFRNYAIDDNTDSDRMRAYDDGDYLYNNLNYTAGTTQQKRVWRSCSWVSMPILADGFDLLSVEDGLIPTTTTIRLNVGKDYRVQMFEPYDEESIRFPLYNFSVPADIFSSVAEIPSLDVSVYPNPVENILFLQVNDLLGPVTYDVIDYHGRIILAEQTSLDSSIPIDVSDLNSGMYLLRVQSEGSASFKPFVVH